jgi:hypothetical protein
VSKINRSAHASGASQPLLAFSGARLAAQHNFCFSLREVSQPIGCSRTIRHRKKAAHKSSPALLTMPFQNENDCIAESGNFVVLVRQQNTCLVATASWYVKYIHFRLWKRD